MHELQRPRLQGQNTVLTLGDAVAAVSEVTDDAREVVAIVLHLLQRQSIRLVGTEAAELHDTGQRLRGPVEEP